jgi:hypothetical protein
VSKSEVGEPLKGFVSYAHVDENWLARFLEALAPLKQERLLALWTDPSLAPGTEWHPELMQRIDQADIIILLVTPAFLRSSFCLGQEVRRALARHDAGLTRLIPVLLEPCAWQDAAFARIQGLPRGMEPVSNAPDQTAIFVQIAAEIRAVALQIRPAVTAWNDGLGGLTNAQLMKMMDNVRFAIEVIEGAIVHLPTHLQPMERVLELAELRRKLQSYENEFQRRAPMQ